MSTEKETTFCTHKGYNTVAPCGKDCPTNHPIEEKWKEEFDSRFTELLLQVDDTAGKDDYCRAAEWVKSFIENLLEQERQRMSDEVKELPWLHNDSGVKELEENVDYVEVKEVMAIINK